MPSPLVHHSLLEEWTDVDGRLALRNGADRGQLFFQRAVIERRLGRSGAARASLRCAEICGRMGVEVAQEKCRLLIASGGHERAAGLMDSWITAIPDDYDSRMLRAEARLGAGAFEGAALDLEKAREASLEQFTIDAELRLAEAWDRAEQRAVALDALDRALQRRGVHPALVQAAIKIELAAKQFDAALQRHDELKPTSGTHSSWLSRRGDLLALAGRTAEARSDWMAAREALSCLPSRRRQTAASTRLLRELNRKLKAPSDPDTTGS